MSLVGERFWYLTVKEKTEKRKRGYVVYKAECDCGREVEGIARDFKEDRKRSCGEHGYIVDLKGDDYFRFKVLEPEKLRNGVPHWKVECETTGEVEIASEDEVKEGNVCGLDKLESKRYDNLTGLVIGGIRIVRKEGTDAYNNTLWRVTCADKDCEGTEEVKSRYVIRNGGSLECGCSWTSEDYSKTLREEAEKSAKDTLVF